MYRLPGAPTGRLVHWLAASVPVKVQRRVSGHWKTVGSATTTSTGAYKKRIRDRVGEYRAKVRRSP